MHGGKPRLYSKPKINQHAYLYYSFHPVTRFQYAIKSIIFLKIIIIIIPFLLQHCISSGIFFPYFNIKIYFYYLFFKIQYTRLSNLEYILKYYFLKLFLFFTHNNRHLPSSFILRICKERIKN